MFVQVEGECIRSGNSYCNPLETEEVAKMVENLLHGMKNTKVTEEDIGICTPYRAQKRQIIQSLTENKLENIKVGTIKEFQGSEKPIIIISTVRSNPNNANDDDIGFLADPKLMNVAVTRAQSLMLIIGNSNQLRKAEFWYEQIKYIADNNGFGRTPV